MSVNPKHDRQGVRTASDIERKYSLGNTAEIMDIATNAQRAATNAQSVANEANTTATQANAMAGQANNAANAASGAASAAQAAVAALAGDVYTKEQTLSPEVKTQLGLSETATPSEAFAALYNLIAGGNA